MKQISDQADCRKPFKAGTGSRPALSRPRPTPVMFVAKARQVAF